MLRPLKACLFAMLLPFAAQAQQAPLKLDETADAGVLEKTAEAKIESLLGMRVSSIANSPIPGLFEAVTNRGLFYITSDAKYFVHGRVYNLDEGMRNETEETLSVLRLDGMKAFDNDTIEFKAENERHVITVFTDITCGYCRKLHNEIDEYNRLGITVRYLAFPRSGIASKSYNDMVSIWCAKDPQYAMTNAKAGGRVDSATCEQKVAEQYSFGQQVGVTGTPAILLKDGSLVPGYQPASKMNEALTAMVSQNRQ